ncbi:MAG TPA: hypothetical protein VFK86_09610 [Bauldia sp.]|nr:hypothetical protein [Bauldia sp.]
MRGAILIATFLIASVSAGSLSSNSARAEWLRYKDPRFGTSTLYPSDLLSERTATETGATFSGTGGYLEISAAHRGIYSIRELRGLIAATPGYDNITYSPEGRNWLVVSGYRGDDIFYEKYFVKNGIVEGFALEYSSAARKVFDPVVETIEDTFRPGR